MSDEDVVRLNKTMAPFPFSQSVSAMFSSSSQFLTERMDPDKDGIGSALWPLCTVAREALGFGQFLNV